MKRAQVAALVAGAALVGVATAVVLSRKESRDQALKLAKTSADLGARSTKVAGAWAAQGSKMASVLAAQGSKMAGDLARQAGEQYQVQGPRAVETLSGVLPRLGIGKKEAETVEA